MARGMAEEGVPFEAEHQRHIFAALETVPDASLDYLRDLAAAHLAALVEAFFRARAAAHKATAAAVALVLDDTDGQKAVALRKAGYTEGELRQAASDGDLERAHQLLELGLNPDAVAESLADWHPLQYAAQQGHTQMCTTLVERGAEIFATDRNDETALMQAAYWGHAETVAEMGRLEGLVADGTQKKSQAPACVVLDKPPVPWDAKAQIENPDPRARGRKPTVDGGPTSVSIICSAPEFSMCGDEVMIGLINVQN